jgi:Bacterial sugar transferase
MSNKWLWLAYLYGWLLRLYPRSYQTLFAEEMKIVFGQALTTAATEGWSAILTLCGREVRDLPRLLLTEYWLIFRQWLQVCVEETELASTDLPGIVPVGYGSLPHILFALTGRNPRLRRLFDLLFASLGLLVAAPVLILLPILIKVDSVGPVFFGQVRVGKDGQPYVMYKFRSMLVADGLSGEAAINPNQPARRVTRVGRLFRRYGLDEVPQLFNVLKGDMSIFGPRPGMPS